MRGRRRTVITRGSITQVSWGVSLPIWFCREPLVGVRFFMEHVFQDLQAQAGTSIPSYKSMLFGSFTPSETRYVFPSIVPFPIRCANSRLDVAGKTIRLTSARPTSRLGSTILTRRSPSIAFYSSSGDTATVSRPFPFHIDSA